jgi:hypothetical protein
MFNRFVQLCLFLTNPGGRGNTNRRIVDVVLPAGSQDNVRCAKLPENRVPAALLDQEQPPIRLFA